jgi:hypothetical protein
MGTVLSFQRRELKVPRPPAKADSKPSVVIFPGVRYERYGAAEITASRNAIIERNHLPETSTRG